MTSTQRYFLGVDTGGTKSHALITDENGRAIGFGQAGSGNHEDVGYDGLVATLHSITRQAFSSASILPGQLAGAGFGIAGYDWPSERQPTLDAIATLGLEAPVEVVNDCVVGLIAGASQGWGVVVNAGTSNNCRGRDKHGREGRITGNGILFGEFGGAGELVMKAIIAVNYEWTRRGPPTRLTQAFIQLVGARDAEDLLEGLSLQYYNIDAVAAPLVFQVAENGDPVARDVIHWSGCELGSLAVGVIRQLGFEGLEFEVVMSGSLFEGGPLLVNPMREAIQSLAHGARLVRLTAPPVVGGVLLGMETAGINFAEKRETLIRSTEQLLMNIR